MLTIIVTLFLGGMIESYKNQEKIRKVFIWILIIFLIIIAGFRNINYVGTDEFRYRVYFMSLIDTKLNLDFAGEWGWYLSNWILANSIKDPQFIILLSSIVINILIIKTIDKYSSNFLLSCIIYITGNMYFYSFMAIRQFIAMAIIVYGIKYIINNQFLKYLLIIIIATSFHSTAIIMLFLYFFSNPKIGIKIQMLVILCFVLVLVNFEIFFSFLIESGILKNTTSYEILFTNNRYGISLIRFIFWCVPGAFMIIKRKEIENNPINYIFINQIIISILIYILSLKFVSIARFNIYFNFSYVIIYPNLLNLIKTKEKYLVFILIIIVFFLFGYYDMIMLLPGYHNILIENISGVLTI